MRIPAEAGGTAIQKVFLAIQQAAAVGGKELRAFSETLKITTEEFRRLVAVDPTEAFALFVKALGDDIDKAQISLEKLGLGNERTRRAFLTAAAAGDHLNEVLEAGEEANREGIARSEEFSKALDTTAGQLRLARAAFNDLAITIGDSVLPVLREAAGLAASVAVGLRQVIELAAEGAGLVKPPDEEEGGGGFLNEGVEVALRALFESTKLVLSGDLEAWLDTADKGSTEAAVEVHELARAFNSASGSAERLELGSALLPPLLDELAEAADEARKAVFKLFSVETQEEASAKLAATKIKREILALQTQQEAFTPADEERLSDLKSQLATVERIGKVEKNRRQELEQILKLEAGDLQTM